MTVHPSILRVLCLGGVAIMLAVVPAASAAPAAPSSPSPASGASAKAVKASASDVKAATGVITELYNAYVSRDLDRIMALERESIEASARAYESKGKGKAEDVRDALRGVTEEVIKHKDFKMKPLNLTDAEFERVGDAVVVSSVIPIIASELVEVGEPGAGKKARLRIGKFVFRQMDTHWTIVRMDLF